MELRTVVLAAAIPAIGAGAYGQFMESPATWDNQTAERVTWFSGKVALPDGSPPPDAVRLRRVCNGVGHDEGWTDAKGHFWFKVGRSDSGPSSGDASQAAGQPASEDKPQGYAYSNPITTELANCELEVALEGYLADSVSLKVAGVGATNLGTIVLRPVSGAGSLTVSATTLKAPPKARKSYDKGLQAIQAKKWDIAASELARAVEVYPRFAAAWYQLGQARLARGDAAGAADAWRESAKADPRFVKPLESMTALADQRQDYTESARTSDAWLQLDPDHFPAAWLFNAVAKARLGRADEAENAARKGLQADKEQRVHRLHYVLGLILLAKHDYAEAATCFRNYLKAAPAARDADAVRRQIADLDRLIASATP